MTWTCNGGISAATRPRRTGHQLLQQGDAITTIAHLPGGGDRVPEL